MVFSKSSSDRLIPFKFFVFVFLVYFSKLTAGVGHKAGIIISFLPILGVLDIQNHREKCFCAIVNPYPVI